MQEAEEPDSTPVRKWRAPTITGPRRVALVEGRTFDLPEDAEVRVVFGSRRRFAFVRSAGRVVVLSGDGELDRDEAAAQYDALDRVWTTIGTPLSLA